ncbi:unnamed protein product [Caretta caretta]
MAFLLPSGTWAGEIIGGWEAKPHSRRYMAYLEIQDGQVKKICGGFLVKTNFVLTAAHCQGDKITVKLGAHNISEQERSQQKIPVHHQIPHQQYDKKTLNNDIMLLQLSYNAKLNNWVRLIPLPNAKSRVRPRSMCSVAGWGWTGRNSRTDTLREVDLEVMRDNMCELYPGYNSTMMLCVGKPGLGKLPYWARSSCVSISRRPPSSVPWILANAWSWWGFNNTLEKWDCSGTEQCPATTDVLWEIVEYHSLVDVWHDHHPDYISTFTFVLVEAHRSRHSRLYRIYLSRFHLSWAHFSSIRPAPFSNHHLATMMASLCAERQEPAYWHFNNSLLEAVGFIASFWEFWLAWRGQWHAFPSVQRSWDLGKVRARLFCRDYTRGASRRRDAVIEQLEQEVLELERRLAASPEDPPLCGACREKQEELRALEDHRAQGAFVRSHINLLQEMDRGSRFFYALVNRRGAKKYITCFLAEESTPVTDSAEMCRRARAFYAGLSSPYPTDPNACRVFWDELLTVSVGD